MKKKLTKLWRVFIIFFCACNKETVHLHFLTFYIFPAFHTNLLILRKIYTFIDMIDSYLSYTDRVYKIVNAFWLTEKHFYIYFSQIVIMHKKIQQTQPFVYFTGSTLFLIRVFLNFQFSK